jgi:hypothetical protein
MKVLMVLSIKGSIKLFKVALQKKRDVLQVIFINVEREMYKHYS